MRNPCLFTERRKLALKFNERKRFRVPDHRRDQTLRCRDRNAEVHIVAINNLVTLRSALKFRSHNRCGGETRKTETRGDPDLDRRVRSRNVLQGQRARARKRAHEAELDLVLFQYVVLVPLAHLHQRRHVNFVERRQERSRVLRLLQTLRDA